MLHSHILEKQQKQTKKKKKRKKKMLKQTSNYICSLSIVS